jgi:hypothetical protein
MERELGLDCCGGMEEAVTPVYGCCGVRGTFASCDSDAVKFVAMLGDDKESAETESEAAAEHVDVVELIDAEEVEVKELVDVVDAVEEFERTWSWLRL